MNTNIERDCQADEIQLEASRKFVNLFFRRLVNNEKNHAIDAQLCAFVIDSFSELFKIWSSFPHLKEVVKQTSFYDVHSMMFESFNAPNGELTVTGSVPGLKVCCEVCDEEFIVTNDLQGAYKAHLNSQQHKETMRIFEHFNPHEAVRLHSEVDLVKAQRKAKTGAEVGGISSTTEGHYASMEVEEFCCISCDLNFTAESDRSSHLSSRWHNYVSTELSVKKNLDVTHLRLINEQSCVVECELCDQVIYGLAQITSHVSSSLQHVHRKSTIFRTLIGALSHTAEVKEIGIENICVNLCGIWYCKLCNLTFSSDEFTMHESTQLHKELELRLVKLLSVEIFVSVMADFDFEKSFKCNLCAQYFTVLADLQHHCNGKAHKIRQERYFGFFDSAYYEKGKNADCDFVFYKGRIPFCGICGCNLSNVGNIRSHLRGNNHAIMKKNMKRLVGHIRNSLFPLEC